MVPSPGQIVQVRSRQYLVEDVVPAPSAHEQTLVRLACLEDDAQGEPLEVLWEKELDARVRSASAWTRVDERGFDPPRLFASYLDTLRWNCVTATDPRLFQAPYRAGIQLHAYQLEPLRKALREPRVNLFIADDVGLGKTIEAGLVLRELLMRQKVRRVVVSCPPSVLLQWQDELEQRFGLSFVIHDRRFVSLQRRERGFGVNPWTTHSRFLISHALLRDEDYAAGLRDWLDGSSAGSLLILDEAHNAAPASGSRYAIDSQLTQVVRDLAPRFEHRLFLSATPHNGHSNSFAALLEILDPLRFCRGVPVKSAKVLESVMVRRLKSDLRELGVGGFPKRELIQLDIDGLAADCPELTLPALLEEYAELREARFAGASKSAQAAAAIVISSLQKRLLSSIEAFACTLAVHRRTIENPPPRKPGAKRLSTAQASFLFAPPDRDEERSEQSEDELAQEDRSAVEQATVVSEDDVARKPTDAERRLLARMAEIADAARGLPDARVDRLVAWIRKQCCPGDWNDRRVLIFTEYADTKRYLEEQLRAAFAETSRANQRIRTFHGGMGEESREEVKRAFNTHPSKHPLRILVATDAAREGVNLQNHCADLFHFDVPWNPMRIEQRNGRIDRKLQREPVVRCHYFFYVQRSEDPVLQALVRKTETIEKELGSLSPVLERRLADRLGGRIRRGRAAALAAEIDAERASDADRATVDEELEAVRKRQQALAEEIEGLRTQLDASGRYLGLDTARFTSAVSAAIQIAGGGALAADAASVTHGTLVADRPEPGESYSVSDGTRPLERFRFPALDRMPGTDPSWADTLDTLRPKRERGVSPHEWRRTAPIRPVVFEAPDAIDDELVQLHLEHRVVRRLLGRFLAQGFVHDDLARACVGQVRDAIPRAVLLGRLSLYGPGAARLHDEVIAVAARWTEPAARKEPLRPYAERAEAETLRLLDSSLVGSGAIPEPVRAKLLAASPRDVADLSPHLTERANQSGERAAKLLAERGEREARDLRALIESQRTRIENERRRYDPAQLSLFEPEERRQKEADRRYWDKRLGEIPAEIEREPARVRAGYAVQATRLEPVGIVYLWPASG